MALLLCCANRFFWLGNPSLCVEVWGVFCSTGAMQAVRLMFRLTLLVHLVANVLVWVLDVFQVPWEVREDNPG